MYKELTLKKKKKTVLGLSLDNNNKSYVLDTITLRNLMDGGRNLDSMPLFEWLLSMEPKAICELSHQFSPFFSYTFGIVENTVPFSN